MKRRPMTRKTHGISQKITRRNKKLKTIPGTGLTVLYHITKAKRDGQDRVWIHLRQDESMKKWRTVTCLYYPHAVDIAFAKENR